MSAFSSSGFSTNAFSAAAFDFGSVAPTVGFFSMLAPWAGGAGATATPPAPPIQSHGGFYDHKKYREYLERLTKATSLHQIPEAIEAAEELIDIPVETPELEKLTSGPVLKGTLSLAPKFDYSALQREIELIKAFLDLQQQQMMEREADDELAFLLMMQ